ncbi:MAG: hypothetical protein P8J59_04360 [Phycisphaerales bacterium]|nr:hypothetical protein [Phycisphaerales bacterium]
MNSCRVFGMCCLVGGWSSYLSPGVFGSTLTGVVIPLPDLDVPLPPAPVLDTTHSSIALPLAFGADELRARDLEMLDFILRADVDDPSMPKIGAFGRVSDIEDPTRGTLGIGGLDIDWRPSSTLAVAVVAGGQIDASDAFRPRDRDRSNWDRDTTEFDGAVRLASRSSAFDGLGFGGESASEANPFVGDRLFRAPVDADGLERSFIATRAVLRPSAGSSIGFVATRGGGRSGDHSLLGFDIDQSIGGQRVQAWIQHSMGDSGGPEGQADHSAVGASIGGTVGSIEYGVAWRRLGDGFESGLGNVGAVGSHAMLGRMGWSVPLDGFGFLKSWKFEIRTRVDTNLEFDPRAIDLVIDAARFLTVSGDQLSFGIEQKRRIQSEGDRLAEDQEERFRIGVDTNPNRPLRLGGSVAFGDPVGVIATAWQGGARWRAAPGIDLGGVIALDERIDGVPAGDTLRTSFDGRATLDERATLAARISFDAAAERISLGQEIGLRIARGAFVSFHLDQHLPSTRDSRARPALRAGIKGSFRF